MAKLSKAKSKWALWATSSPTSNADFRAGLKRLRELKIGIFIPRPTAKFATKKESAARPFLAGPDSAKVQALKDILKLGTVENVFTTRGGYGGLRLIPLIDRLAIRGRRLRIWGFSDLTTIQNYFYLRFGWDWVHSPMLMSQAFNRPTGREKTAWTAMTKGGPAEMSFRLKHVGGAPLRRDLTAPLLGGNLTCLNSLLVMPGFRPPKRRFILFLEDLNEKGYRLDRNLVQLAQSDYLAKCDAVTLGHFTDCPGHLQILRAWAKENKLPLFTGVPAGHQSENVPLWMGKPVRLTRARGVGILTVPLPPIR